jgi:hypothetical protein
MSVRPANRPGVGVALGSLGRSRAALERWPPGRWVYVGDYPSDPDTTPDSPPFENSWGNAGGGNRRLRFRRSNEWQTEIAGSVTGGAAGTVVTTLPDLYRVDEVEYAAAGTSGGGVAVWQLQPNGELIYIGSLVTGGSGTDLTAVHYDVPGESGTLLDVNAPDIVFTAGTSGMGMSSVSGIGISTDGDRIYIYANNTGIEAMTNQLEIHLGAFATFKIYDSSNNQIVGVDDSGAVTVNSDDSVTFNAANDIQSFLDGLFGVFANPGGGVDLYADSTGIQIRDNSIEIALDTGATFTITDHLGNKMLEMTEGSPDLHIPTGGNVVADL